ncbi:MAG: 4'-phosphopantetheinyl transferase family protein [Aggregatilineales bacterium]
MPDFIVPALQQNEIHIWQMPILKYVSQYDYFRSLLSPDEIKRANRYIHPEHGREFSLVRGYLRYILAQYLDKSPEKFIFHYNPQRKPSLKEGLHFNLSHSHEQVVMAFSRDYEVGIDLEYMDTSIDTDMLAERFFADEEVQKIQAYQGDMRRQAFFKCWTGKEAYVKVCGEGLFMPLKQFVVDVNPAKPAKLLAVHDNPAAMQTYTLQSIHVSNDYAATLAVAGHDFSIVEVAL